MRRQTSHIRHFTANTKPTACKSNQCLLAWWRRPATCEMRSGGMFVVAYAGSGIRVRVRVWCSHQLDRICVRAHPCSLLLCLKHRLFQQTRAMTLLQSLCRRLPKSPPEATTDLALVRQQREAEQKFPLRRIMHLPLHLSITQEW